MNNEIIKVHSALMNTDILRDKFNSILGENAANYMTSVLNIIKANDKLQECEPTSIWNAALCSAAMHLPIDAGLGYAYIVPYKDNKKKTTYAQFQIGAKGFQQLAERTKEYAIIHETDVRQGEIRKKNRLTGQIEFNWIENDAERAELPIIGYVSYFMLNDGYSSTLYMSMDELMEHARKYSKMYQNDLKYGSKSSKWSIPEERGAMCIKTVKKLNLSHNGPLSVEIQKASRCDNAVIDDNGEPMFIDKSEETPVPPVSAEADALNAELSDMFTGEVSPPPAEEPPLPQKEPPKNENQENKSVKEEGLANGTDKG